MDDSPAFCTNWKAEAEAVIEDVKQHVHKITISNLPNSENKILFNLTTLENKDFCVELTKDGFRIVGEKYDSEDKKGKYSIYETPYSMLDNLSPAYRDSFGEELFQKLKQLKEDQEEGKRETFTPAEVDNEDFDFDTTGNKSVEEER